MEGDYSKTVWIIGIALAVLCLLVDTAALLGLLGDGGDVLRQSSVISIPLSVYVLYKSIVGLKKKLDEEKQG